MRSDLQAILNLPTNSPSYPVSIGQMPQDKLCVLAFLYMRKFAGNVQLNEANCVGKATGMQGITADNMIDLQIEGLATAQGFGGFGWPALLAAARAAINGQGVSSGGLNKWLTYPDDYNDLINYCLLTMAGILSDAS